MVPGPFRGNFHVTYHDRLHVSTPCAGLGWGRLGSLGRGPLRAAGPVRNRKYDGLTPGTGGPSVRPVTSQRLSLVHRGEVGRVLCLGGRIRRT